MARGRRLRKSACGELEMSMENDTILLPIVAVSDEAILLPNVVV